ncbi:MAG: hypothetical protein IJV56_00340 [Neisseriaceae bacterium]|nr:hypothetical protein [Neisseriaceae bacterium]MBQ9723780.1 hypothetical protein [Neisseriaceae bacterium]
MKSAIKFFVVWFCSYILFVAMTHGVCHFQQYYQPFVNAVKNAARYQYYTTAVELIISLLVLLGLTFIGFFIANLPFHLLKIDRRSRAFFFFLLFLIATLTITFLSYYTWLYLGNQSYDFNVYECRNYLKYLPKFK